ncbi:hypothetical protein EYF80_051036 [Liparis tanakae]|uniref:Uncharacterized protein n=1 Tax=Liparis tanakae TaxID=230148 RepID=A0A4Z2FD01_9TELE|nr:hypothetical protein EYF80_051036 [Liparis tanakae]
MRNPKSSFLRRVATVGVFFPPATGGSNEPEGSGDAALKKKKNGVIPPEGSGGNNRSEWEEMHRRGRGGVSDDQAARCRFSVEDYRDVCTPPACSDHIKAKWCEVQFCSVLFMCDGFDFDIPLRQEEGRKDTFSSRNTHVLQLPQLVDLGQFPDGVPVKVQHTQLVQLAHKLQHKHLHEPEPDLRGKSIGLNTGEKKTGIYLVKLQPPWKRRIHYNKICV